MGSNNITDDFIQKIEDANTPEDHSSEYNKLDELARLRKDRQEFGNLDNKDKDQDIKLKKIYGISILCGLGIWVLFVITYMFMHFYCPLNRLSDNVIITLLTTTTANILVLPTIVIRYLFPKKKM